jgi:hypothetical protein
VIFVTKFCAPFRPAAGLYMYNSLEVEDMPMLKKLLISSAFGLLLSVGTAVCADVIVTIRPPAAIVETKPARPGANFVWLGGYQRWDPAAKAYVWEKGRWEAPPRPGARWVAHRWVHRGTGWVFVEGRWR